MTPGPSSNGLAAIASASRLAQISRLGLTGDLGDPDLDAIVETLAAACEVPIAVINIVTPNLQTYPAQVGVGAGCTQVPDSLSFCAEVVSTARELLVPDSLRHPVYAQNPLVRAGAIRSYAGEPLVHEGTVIGSVSIFDDKARTFSDADLVVLRAQSRLAAAVIALRASAAWDSLTGLALRPLLLDRAERALLASDEADSPGGRTALLVLDVLGMTAINEAFGSSVGDHVLRTVAERISAACSVNDSPARIGGDEFAVLFESVGSARQARARAAAIVTAASTAQTGEAIALSFRTGLAMTPSEGADALLASAERSATRRSRLSPISLLDATESPMCAVAADGTIRAVNAPWQAFAMENGGDPNAVGVGMNYLSVCDEGARQRDPGAAEVAAGLRQLLSGGLTRFEHDYPCHAPDRERWFSLRASRQPNGPGAVISHHDVTATKVAERIVSRQSLRDALTDLPNRGLLIDRLEQALQAGVRARRLVAAAALRLDGFDDLCAEHGTPACDLLLGDVARRLGLRLRDGDTLARVDIDQFVVVFRDLGSAEQAYELAAGLVQVFAPTFEIATEHVHLTASIGVSVDEGSQTAGQLLFAADRAMREAMGRGPGHLRVFTPALPPEATSRLRTAEHLRSAIERDELVVHYQPVIDLVVGTAVGVEALVRWQHPTDGLIAPDMFIPLAEAHGLISALGAQVLERSCVQAMSWLEQGLDLQMAVNLSTRQIADPALIDTVADILARTGMEPDRLVFEVTESAVMEDAEAAAVVLNRLAELGVSLAIDDFGTGYSSLVYLKRYPIRALKIDRTFVAGMGLSDEDDAIVASVVGLARAVGGACIAEGIETQEQYAALRALGCSFGQGWLFGKAVAPEWLPALIEQCERSLAGLLLDLPAPGEQRDAAGDRRDQAAYQRDQVADERDHVGDERDRVGDRRDVVGDRRDVAGDERDVAAELRDEVAHLRDDAADNRDHVGEERDRAGAKRDHAGDARDEAADRRDQLGAHRDAAGDQRDRAAGRRDIVAEKRDHAADQRDEAADQRDAAAERTEWEVTSASPPESASSTARQEAASDRSRASEDRRAGASERTQAEHDRSTALADRGAGANERTLAERDREVALADRGAGAGERTNAERDRDVALADRGAGASERRQAEQDRGVALSDRDAGADERTHAEEDRDVALADRDAGAQERSHAEGDRGTAHSDRGAGASERDRASMDDLTGAYSRGAGLIEMRREIARVRRAGEAFLVAYVDVDGLKAVNDSRGHAAGDELLRTAAMALAAQLRSYDLVIRVGGDEFVCTLSSLTVDEATRRLSLAREALLASPLRGSFSFGFAELHVDDDVEELLARADAALYLARHQARSPA